MLKGIQKNMIWVKTPESTLFESAYFVLRPTHPHRLPENGEMVREANRLVCESTRPEAGRHRRNRHHWRSFLSGALCGLLLSCFFALLALLCHQSP